MQRKHEQQSPPLPSTENGVSKIGPICFEKTVIGFIFDRGVTSAYFHFEGSFCSANEELKIEHNGSAKKSSYSLRTQLGNPSGPDTLRGFKAA